MSRLLIRGGRVIDPAEKRDGVFDVLVVDGEIAEIGTDISASVDETIEASGKVVCPGLIDIHVHLREPGREDKETIASGTRAAASGGYTTICPMPNTNPVIDSSTGVNYVRAVAARDGVVRVLPIAAVTRGQEGKDITEFGDLEAHGAIAFSDDGYPVHNPEIMRRALEYTAMLGRPIMDHAELPELVGDGVMHQGEMASRLGLRGIPAAAETACVARDIELAAETGGHIHICHVSTARACELIAEGKRRGVRVTAEATPHHLVLTDEAIGEFDTMARVAPPLRSADDRAAIRQALRDGIIDCIATDHAPHTDIEKDAPFDQATPGMIALDFAFVLLFTELVKKGEVNLEDLIERMTIGPAKVLGLKAGTLAVGSAADIAIFDPEGTTTVTRERVFSKSFNTPFQNHTFSGAITHTIVGGDIVFADGRIFEKMGVATR
ncbi:dihydroorotase [bacterium]|nr:dihydroorotase [bacterium]